MHRTVIVLLALALVLPLAGCGGDSSAAATSVGTTPAGADGAQAPRAGWTVVNDDARGFWVSFPSDWRRARRSLTPHLLDPREILSVGTGPLVPASGGCAHMPVGALSRLGPRDALVSIQESRHPSSGYPARPARFRLGRANLSEAAACLSDPTRLDTWFMPFGDGDRAFYALVALGRPATGARRKLAERVLDSLRFTAKTHR